MVLCHTRWRQLGRVLSRKGLLDTCVYKGNRFKNTSILDVRTYYKVAETFLGTHISLPATHQRSVKVSSKAKHLDNFELINSSETTFDENIRQFKSCLRVRGYPDTLVNKVLSEVKFRGAKVGTPTKRKNAQENSTFCHTIPHSGAQFKNYLDEQMAFNTESAFAERNIQRASHYLVQKRKIIQSRTRLIQTLKAKNTHSHATGVVQACHNFLISKIF